MDGADQPYGRSADAYDLVYDGVGRDYETEAAAVAATVRGRLPTARTLLDVACGTGGHLRHLREGFTVEGVELSSHMAAIARRRLPGVTIHEADMRLFDLDRQADVVTCLDSSIGYARTPEDLHRAVGAMARHLVPGGVLVLDAWYTPATWPEGYVGAAAAADEERAVTRADRSWRLGRTSVVEMTWVIVSSSGADTFVERHELGLLDASEIRAALAAAGLGDVEELANAVGDDRSRWVASAPM